MMIPCCFHPTRVVVIDDHDRFLRRLDSNLSYLQATYLYYTNPDKALGFLNTQELNPFTRRYIRNVDEEAWEHRRLDINVCDLHNEIYRPERFNEISVVVVDYSMPDMNGLEFCQQLNNPHIQKILLTGEADEEIAVRAFNQGLIHQYIRKQAPDMVECLQRAIDGCQVSYFAKLSKVMIEAITAVHVVDHALTDQHFQGFFKTLMRENNFLEAYLCETMGSFLFLDEGGHATGLVVNTKEQQDVWLDSTRADHIQPQLLQALKARQKMMVYHSREGDLEPEAEDWEKHAHDPQQLQGIKTLYSYVLAPNLFDINAHEVLSFAQFKKNSPCHTQTV
ncbi:MAG: response regulator [Alphaproteobacteria bacterium]